LSEHVDYALIPWFQITTINNCWFPICRLFRHPPAQAKDLRMIDLRLLRFMIDDFRSVRFQ